MTTVLVRYFRHLKITDCEEIYFAKLKFDIAELQFLPVAILKLKTSFVKGDFIYWLMASFGTEEHFKKPF